MAKNQTCASTLTLTWFLCCTVSRTNAIFVRVNSDYADNEVPMKWNTEVKDHKNVPSVLRHIWGMPTRLAMKKHTWINPDKKSWSIKQMFMHFFSFFGQSIGLHTVLKHGLRLSVIWSLLDKLLSLVTKYNN